MKRNLLLVCLMLVSICFFSGCASVPMASVQADLAAKEFKAPTNGKAGVYIYRSDIYGAGNKIWILIDGQPIGQTAARTYYYIELTSGNHIFKGAAANDSVIHAELSPNKLYYIRHELMMGKLLLVDEEEGQRGVNVCRLAFSNPIAATE
jgi:hypothetical protein